MNGTDLLAEFRETRSEKAFGELVKLYTNLVYSVAMRRLSNVSLAQEVTQSVFIRLAKAVPKIRGDAELVAWLHRTTVHVSIDLWRSESRRRAREQHVAAMQPDRTEETVWNDIAPVVDEALNELGETDRQAILLRFFEQRSMRDLGSHLGISEDAAKMRVSRAMDKLRSRLGGIGATCTAAALATMLSERSVEAAPAEVASTLAALRVPVSAGLTASGWLGALLAQSVKAKFAAAVTAVIIVGGGVLLVRSLMERGHVSPRGDVQAIATSPDVGANGATVLSSTSNGAAGTVNVPDPCKLLQGVASARRRILSGEMEFTFANYQFDRPFDGTNVVRLKALFDDNKFRFESFGREYRYTSMEPNTADVTEARRRAEGLDRDASEKAGLIQGFDSHQVTAFDGAVFMRYWEAGDQQPDAAIYKPGEGWGFRFDPRTLGLATVLAEGYTVETCLRYSNAKSVQLMGKETVSEVPCWHVRLQSAYNESVDFWIDAERPVRVIKHAYGSNVTMSKYDDNDPKNPIPAEVRMTSFRNGAPSDERTITCASAKYNIPVPPVSWTLAGLGMKVGTSVNDNRINRRLGYWTGTGLSDNFPSKTPAPEKAPNREEMLALLDVDPTSPEALEAAHWIILNTPDGPEVEKAADVMVRNHIQSTNMQALSHELERMRPAASRRLLEGMMEKNPQADVRGNACFTLATLQKDAANYGSNKVATAEAVRLFERVISDFSQVKRKNGYLLPELAKPELSELRHLIIGKPAPEIEGEDLDGQPIKLSDYRGKVVGLVFWGHCGGCRPQMRPLLDAEQRLAGKPFAILGVYTDDHPDDARSIAQELGMTWPSFKEERSGPISVAWNMHRWPNIWLVDAKGVIRQRDVPEELLARVAEALMGDQ